MASLVNVVRHPNLGCEELQDQVTFPLDLGGTRPGLKFKPFIIPNNRDLLHGQQDKKRLSKAPGTNKERSGPTFLYISMTHI